MNIKVSLAVRATALTVSMGALSAPTFAQEESAEDAAIHDAVLDEVIVTAQRRAENVQDVPISMTVLSEEQISNNNMTNAADLATYTPSLSIDTRFGYENTSFAIRGFTQSLRTTASVATYFAEVVAPRGQTSQTSGDGAGPGYLFDLQNVQVLKGPQGTLFGRNTTGGAILLTPQEPTDVFEGYLEGSLGNFDAKRLQGVVNFPVSDTFRVRLGVDSNERDGHLNNITGIGADELGNSNYTATRLSMSWDVVEGVENYTIFQYVDSDTKGYTAKLIDCPPGSSIVSGTNCIEQLERQRQFGQDGFYDLASTIKTPVTTIEEKRVINTTTWEINDDITFKNIAAYAHLETTNGSSVFGTDFREPGNTGRQYFVGSSVINPAYPVTSQETYVEEMQLQGTAMDESLTWQTGLYYENSRPDGISGNNSAAFINCNAASLEVDPVGLENPFDCNATGISQSIGGVLVQKFKTEFLNKAIFGQATYDISEQWSVTGGLRYTQDEAKGEGIKQRYTFNGTTPLAPTITQANPKVTSEEPTGMIEVSYHPAEDVMTYAKYTRGYRQGSVNLAADVGLDTHDPETIDTYEIGAKTSFGGPIPGQFNIAIFDNELTDMQLQNGYLSVMSGPTTAITNAGKAVVRGVEVDTAFKLTDDLTLNVAYSHLSTELKETELRDISQNGGFNLTPIALEGDELPFAPKNTWISTLNYLLPAPSELGVISFGATWVYIGEQRTAASDATPYDVLPAYELLNLNASWMGIMDSNFDLSLFATNVTDKEYMTYYSGSWNTLGLESGQTGLPRMYGARVRYNFGG